MEPASLVSSPELAGSSVPFSPFQSPFNEHLDFSTSISNGTVTSGFDIQQSPIGGVGTATRYDSNFEQMEPASLVSSPELAGSSVPFSPFQSPFNASFTPPSEPSPQSSDDTMAYTDDSISGRSRRNTTTKSTCHNKAAGAQTTTGQSPTPFRCEFPGCRGKGWYPNEREYRRHLKHHEKPVKCDFCSEFPGAAGSKELNRHVRKCHPEKVRGHPKYKRGLATCPTCGYTRRSDNVNRHRKVREHWLPPGGGGQGEGGLF
ncbi:hypothetical protein VTK26DRAFT_3738 [Humicola hyalothermophila]